MLRRIRALLFSKRLEDDLHSELHAHVEMMVRKNIAHGMTPDEAQRQAGMKFGSIASIAEQCRDERGVNLMESLMGDLRYAFRQFRRAPVFVGVAILSIAVGIGANTAIFTVIDELMLKSLPVRNPEELVSLRSWLGFGGAGVWSVYGPSYSRFTELRKNTDAFSDMAAIYQESAFIEGQETRFTVVSANYFTTLGVNAAIGRTFTPDDDLGRGNHAVAIISHAFWQRHYGLSPDILGRTFSLKGTMYTIVGVMPAGFSGDEIGVRRDVWFPMTMIAQVMSDRAALASNPDSVQVGVVARLKPNVTLKQAESQVQTVYRRLAGDATGAPLVALESHESGYSRRREFYAKPLEILAIVIGIVLLIACANVANLLLARATARQKETAVRLALGAGRLRILRQHLTESMVLAFFAGLAGMVLAIAGTQALANFVSVGPLALELNLTPDSRVLLFAAAVSLVTGLVFGTTPAWRASRVPVLRVAGLTATTSMGERRIGLGQLLVLSQVALSVFLLIGAGLFVRTFRNLKFQDLGYDRDNVLLVTSDRLMNLDGKGVLEAYETIRQRIESIPGVASVGYSTAGLLTGSGFGLNPVTVEGYTRRPGDPTSAGWNIVAPGYFKTIGMRLSGRDFNESDTAGTPRVAIINETMARHYFGNTNPIGRRFGVRRDNGNEIEIIGVLKDAKYNLVREQQQDMIYFPYLQEMERMRAANLVIRTNGDVSDLPRRVREILTGIAPDFPIVSIEWVDGQLNRLLMIERLTANLASLFGALAALLACVGVYGVISYNVASRTSEIGMRVALGAGRSDVLVMVMKKSIALVLGGILVGVPAGFAAAHIVSSQLFGVSPMDPITAIAAVLLMLVSSSLAALIPARRAAMIDPMVALRYE